MFIKNSPTHFNTKKHLFFHSLEKLKVEALFLGQKLDQNERVESENIW